MRHTARGTDKDTALLIGGNATIFEAVPEGSGAKLHLSPGECAMVVNNAEEDLSIYAAVGAFAPDLMGTQGDEVILLPGGQTMLFARYSIGGEDFVFHTGPLADLIESDE